MKAKARKTKRLITKGTLRSALVAGLKAQTGRKDLRFEDAPEVAARTQQTVKIEERAGFPLKIAKGSVHPKDWLTHSGCKIEVDFGRAHWLPDDWGQGIKATLKTWRSMKGGGGILTTFVAPDGKSFFHKHTSEAWAGRPLGAKEGFNGQVRLARLQALQAVQLARAQIKDQSSKGGGSQQLIGTDPDSTIFKLLSPKERRNLPSKDDFHFCVVSARRATKLEGVQYIWMVQTQLLEAGVTPTWYVDKESLKDYQALGLRAVIGGKLTEARTKCLHDARRLGKLCVQLSDDISAWEYRDGKNAKERNDDAQNAAHAAAKRLIVSPVAAARFIAAKMRSCEEPKPKLGGVYMLSSCSRTFCGDAFLRHHFILGDFFVVEPSSKVNFDPEMRLKEDYDFTCAHIKAYGSVLRCQRMTLNVKHYANGGGACSNRDSKGEEEKRNVAILHKKWPGAFRANPKRKNEVIMRWRINNADVAAEDDNYEEGRKTVAAKVKGVLRTIAKKKPASSSR